MMCIKNPIAVVVLASALLLGQRTNADDSPSLRAGAATSNITPPLGESIVGGWTPLPADSVHDELWARCLVLDDGQTRLAIVLCDNVGISRAVFDAAKETIEQTTGIPQSHQLMASTHTHSATTARGPNAMETEQQLSGYQQFLASRISDGVRRAVKNLQPARIGWGRTEEASEVFNRRWFVADEEDRRNPFGGVDQVRMNPGGAVLVRPAGPIDPEIAFVSVQSASGQPLALLANYSLHYVGGVPAREISADYFGVFARHLGRLLETEDQHPPFVGILSNGTSGDVNNINFRERGPRLEPYEKIEAVGRLIAKRVFEALPDVQYRERVTLDARARELVLDVRKPDEELLEYVRSIQEKPEDQPPYHTHEKTYAGRVLQLHQSPDQVSVPLQVLRIGDLGIAAIPFEVFAEIGLEIKSRSPVQQTFTIELANGSYGYLPTPRQHELGGYETWLGTNKVEKEASVKIVDAILEMFQEVQGP